MLYISLVLQQNVSLSITVTAQFCALVLRTCGSIGTNCRLTSSRDTALPRLRTINVQSLSRVLLFATPWTIAHQAPLSMEFSRQEFWSGVPIPPPGYLPHPGTEPVSLASPALEAHSLPLEPWEAL